MPEIPGETSKDRRRQLYAGIGAMIALFSLIGSTILLVVLIQTTNSHDATITRQDATITQQASTISRQDRHIVSLEKQHGADIENEHQLLTNVGLADSIIVQYVTNLDNALNTLCAAAGAGCSIHFTPNPPPPGPPVAPVHPTPPHTTSTPAPTHTTVAPTTVPPVHIVGPVAPTPTRPAPTTTTTAPRHHQSPPPIPPNHSGPGRGEGTGDHGSGHGDGRGDGHNH